MSRTNSKKMIDVTLQWGEDSNARAETIAMNGPYLQRYLLISSNDYNEYPKNNHNLRALRINDCSVLTY